jgi:hypothetical protein
MNSHPYQIRDDSRVLFSGSPGEMQLIWDLINLPSDALVAKYTDKFTRRQLAQMRKGHHKLFWVGELVLVAIVDRRR